MKLPLARFKIQDRSMEPTLNPGDYIIVNQLAYAFGAPSKGDLVVLKHPENSKLLVKRISLVSENKKIFVVGDNKDYSTDSRHFGPVDKNLIVGRVVVHIKP